ncbi:MAG: GyrI-like domain-containing protein [Acidobacteriia bacterium]|nr:GyrI-like domain-containing protein [Terriglobia bacterium]
MQYAIATKEISPQPAVVLRRNIKPAEIASALAEMFPRVIQYAAANGMAIAGAPFARYLAMGPDWRIEAGMPVAAASAGSGDGEIAVEALPGGAVAVTTHSGPYDQLRAAHAAIQEWLKAEGYKAAGPAWESYINDPGDFPDPKDWKTEVFVPIAR